MGKEIIGDYDVDTSNPDHYLGGGTFGQVYLAFHRKTGKKAAAKKIPTLNSEERRSFIRKEIQMLEKIQDHPKVLKLLQVKEFADAIWIVTEFCDEEDLAKYCKKKGCDLKTMLDISIQVMKIITDLHGRKSKIVHRDLKPENILLISNGPGKVPTAKVGDYGLATAINRPGTLPLTTFGGTLLYMSPEFFSDEVRYNELVDVFSMGLVLYTLMQYTGGDLRCMESKLFLFYCMFLN